MRLVWNISKQELNEISKIIGEAFVNNELFHEFGSIEKRKSLVLKYMNAYVKCVYDMKALYQSDDGKAYIGLVYSDKKFVLPKIKLLLTLIKIIPFNIMKRFLKHAKEIADVNKEYTKDTYLEVLMVCVKKENQGQGYAKELVYFAKQMAKKRNVPLLFDTDMKDYAQMYQHLGCKLYNVKKASNGVTRYNLVWKSDL